MKSEKYAFYVTLRPLNLDPLGKKTLSQIYYEAKQKASYGYQNSPQYLINSQAVVCQAQRGCTRKVGTSLLNTIYRETDLV